MNKVILGGRLGRDPEVRYTQSGKAVCSFSIAVNRDFKKGDHPEADWVEIIAWEKLAEVCGNNLTKGRRVLVEGRLQVRYYEPQDGSGKRKVTEVVAQKVEFLDYKKDGQAEAPAADSASSFGQDVLPEEEIPF